MTAIVSRDGEYGEMEMDSNTTVTATGLVNMYTIITFVQCCTLACHADVVDLDLWYNIDVTSKSLSKSFRIGCSTSSTITNFTQLYT